MVMTLAYGALPSVQSIFSVSSELRLVLLLKLTLAASLSALVYVFSLMFKKKHKCVSL